MLNLHSYSSDGLRAGFPHLSHLYCGSHRVSGRIINHLPALHHLRINVAHLRDPYIPEAVDVRCLQTLIL